MKPKKLWLTLVLIILGLTVIILVIINTPSKEEIRAEEIIQSFMKTQGLDINPGTDEYKTFMRRIFWGEYPELTGVGSIFINDPDDLDCVYAYAWKYSGYKDLYGEYHDDIDLQEAIPPTPTD